MMVNLRSILGKTKMQGARPIPGYSHYFATRDGRVYTTRLRKGWMVPGVDRNGYTRYSLVGDNGKRKGMYAHQIIALTYIPNPEGKPFVNHKDFDKANNSVENLEWCTQGENIRHDWTHGRRKGLQGIDNGSNKYPEFLIRELRDLFDAGKYTQMELARKFDMPFPTIHVIVRRKQWRNVS